jgi:hypothetical protein
MPMFEAIMRVTHMETWAVEAEDKDMARVLLMAVDDRVHIDETGGETVDWEIVKLFEPREGKTT